MNSKIVRFKKNVHRAGLFLLLALCPVGAVLGSDLAGAREAYETALEAYKTDRTPENARRLSESVERLRTTANAVFREKKQDRTAGDPRWNRYLESLAKSEKKARKLLAIGIEWNAKNQGTKALKAFKKSEAIYKNILLFIAKMEKAARQVPSRPGPGGLNALARFKDGAKQGRVQIYLALSNHYQFRTSFVDARRYSNLALLEIPEEYRDLRPVSGR